MKCVYSKLAVSALTLLFILGCITENLAQQISSGTFMYDGIERSYMQYTPSNLEPNAPLVFNLHGYGSNGTEQMFYSNMNATAEANGFMVIYPNGTNDVNNTPHWNAGLMISQTDDVGFLVALAEYLQTEFDLDPERTFSCGMSNGGFMSYHLACNANQTFGAIASVTGTMNQNTFDNCNPGQAVPVLEIHGTADFVVPYLGAPNIPGWGNFIATPDVIDFWVDNNGCGDFTEAELPNTDPNDNSTVSTKIYNDCNGNSKVWLYTINNGGHDWPGAFFGQANQDVNASDVIWEFFSQYDPITNTIEAKQERFKISPNPTSDILQIENAHLLKQIQLLNTNGRVIQSFATYTSMIDVSDLPNGLYIIQFITNNGQISTQKLIIQ
ncbi:MAG: T9SS type A sorting domain-containing protein [Saprospiraceae bacterium]|nr:T9SS type A sorting domain-containing protein [Saprospiraceae bacterium]